MSLRLQLLQKQQQQQLLRRPPTRSTIGQPAVKSLAKFNWLMKSSTCAPRSCSCPPTGNNSTMIASLRHHHPWAAAVRAATAAVPAVALRMPMRIGCQRVAVAHRLIPSARIYRQHHRRPAVPRNVPAPMDAAWRIVRLEKRSRTKMPPHVIVRRRKSKWSTCWAKSRS